ncbi:virginiamycin B lyase family protein [Nocardia sp. IBHARD005]|uniref:virginiamycin B lyase family protein n=1 Tax=Nocardia sp. IBHARD005 TaxID=3457765 RepID=UPI0040595985
MAGPDGARWFTEWASCRLGRIATDGTITHLDLPGAEPHGLTVDPAGYLWVAMESGALVQVSPS